MDMQDRAIRGFFAGVFGAFIEMIFTLTSYGFGFNRLRFMDFAAIATFNHTPDGLWQTIFAELVVWTFCGSIGAGFAFLLKAISSKNVIVKGGIFGILSWFFIYALVTLFRIEGLYPLDFATSAVHFTGGVIYGISTAYAFVYLTKKFALKAPQRHTMKVNKVGINPTLRPAMKPLGEDNENKD